MVFSSVTFLFFFLPLFLAVYLAFKIQHKRNLILLGFSLVFYAWGEPAYVLLMILSIIANWYFGRRIDVTTHSRKRIAWTTAAIFFNLGMLGVFKYAPLLIDTTSLLGIKLPYSSFLKQIALPIGISFYTFQALSYLIDLYRGHFHHERNILDLGTYIAMFPQLIAGPIVRFESIREQLHNTRILWPRILSGSKLFVIGLASKVLIANTFAGPADHVFSLDASLLSMPLAWLGAISYFFQIFFDFNGYSLMAIGLGQIIGFDFPRNFDRPYIARSITEFWRRWHISLSTWFRDYLYIPLGGSRGSALATYRNLVVVFLLCGLWHGAGFNFLAWGAYHGIFLVIERSGRGSGIKVPFAVAHLYTLLVVLFGWVLFRCESFTQVADYLAAMLGAHAAPAYLAAEVLSPEWVVAAAIAAFLSSRHIDYHRPPLTGTTTVAITTYGGLFVLCVVALVVGTHNPFIYFRF
jgi:alginate O-acetyltransferase complex protein AlgI